VIVATGLEFESDMDGWFRRNREAFDRQKMIFQGSACITATKGMVNGRPFSYDDSKEKVERLVNESYSMAPWRVPRRSWFAETVLRVIDVFGFNPSDFDADLLNLLKSYGGLTDKEVKYLAKKMGRRTKDRHRI